MSNRLTFSLASLIFLIAFGLVFAPSDAMAHVGTGPGGTKVGNEVHDHPFADTLPAVDINEDGDMNDPGEAEVTKHNDHPTPTISLVADQDNVDEDNDIIMVTAAAATFKVQVDFGMVVSNAATDETAVNDLTFAPVIAVVNAAKTGIISNGATVSTAFARQGTSNQILEATVTINTAGLPTGVTDATATGYATRETYFRIRIPEDSVFSLELNGLIAKDGTTVVDDVVGSGNPASSKYVEFKLVKVFDKTGPVATVTADSTKFNTAGDAVFTIEFDEALASSGDGALAVGDFDIANGTGTLSGPTSATEHEYTLTVTPIDVNEGVKVTLKKDSVTDALGNEGPTADESAMVVEDIDPAVTVSVAQVVKPSATDPTKDTKAKFNITFTEELSASHFNKFDLINDLTIVGGTAVAADLTGPTTPSPAVATDLQPDQIYELTVTPDASLVDGDEVSVTVNPQIQDKATNNIDLTRGTPSASFNIDLLAPTVVITAPTAPLATPAADAGKLEFEFLFSEPIDASTFDASDILGEDYVVTDAPMKDATYTPPAGTMKERWTAKVKPTDDDDVTVVLNVQAVDDKVGRKLSAGAFATYKGPNTDPFFPANAAVLNLPAGLCVEDALPANVTLPLANDTEGDTLTYSLTGGTPATRTIPNASRAAGFYWETIDTQTRVLKGTATLADNGTYTWMVTDSHGDSHTMTFSIIVKDHQLPAKPTGLAAAKVEADSVVSPTKNRVRLTWTAPTDQSAYPACIPAVTGYTVTRRTFDRLAGTFGNAMTHTVPSADVMDREFDLPELPTGIYDFTITATNSVGDSPASDAAVWDVTEGTRVVVADPPASPTDLDTTINSNSVTLDWLKVPDAQDGGAPIHDDMVAGDAKLTKVRSDFYGPGVTGDYAGYVVYQTNEQTAVVTRYPETGTLMAAGDSDSDDADDPFNYTHPGLPG